MIRCIAMHGAMVSSLAVAASHGISLSRSASGGGGFSGSPSSGSFDGSI